VLDVLLSETDFLNLRSLSLSILLDRNHSWDTARSLTNDAAHPTRYLVNRFSSKPSLERLEFRVTVHTGPIAPFLGASSNLLTLEHWMASRDADGRFDVHTTATSVTS
jgi:hypothetical protein